MNRFFIPKYIFNTVRIKMKSFLLRLKNGKYPFAVKEGMVDYKGIPSYTLKYTNTYDSFGYFDFNIASKYYENKPSTIHSIMLAIVDYNGRVKGHNIDADRMIKQAIAISKKATYKDGLPHFLVKEQSVKFDLFGEVHSGIIQAKASSFFLRVFKETEDTKYLHWAKSSIDVCLKPKNTGGIKLQSETVKAWTEEYNTEKPSMVLNGFIFCLIATAEFLSFKEDYELRTYLDKGLQTLEAWIPHYKVNGDILYSMYTWDLSNIHYMGVLYYQLDHLFSLTQLEFIKDFRDYTYSNTDLGLFKKMFS